MDFAAIKRPAFGTAAQHLDEDGPPARKTTKADRRYQRAAKVAAEVLPELPAPGEAVHMVMLGTYDLCQVIVDVARRHPECRHLRIATLCYSKRNIAELCGLLDSRRRDPLALTLLVSGFFQSFNKEMHERSVEELSQFPGVSVGVARSHCKVVCYNLGPAEPLVLEGSANLRANTGREQLTAIRDRPLHDWHANWIDELVKGNAQSH